MGGQVAAGQLYSTVTDTTKWLSLQFLPSDEGDEGGEGQQIISGRSIRAIQHPQFLASSWSAGYCLPWLARQANDGIILGQDGGEPGFQTIKFIAERSLGVIGLYNGFPASELTPKIFEIVIEAFPTPGSPANTISLPQPVSVSISG